MKFLKNPLDTSGGSICEYCNNTGILDGVVKMSDRGREKITPDAICKYCNTYTRLVQEGKFIGRRL